MLTLYNVALLPFRLVATALAAWRGRSAAGKREWAERRARTLPDARPDAIWIHGSSVGESRIVQGVAAALRRVDPRRPLVVSAFTNTGRAQLPGSAPADASFLLPLDFPSYHRRLLRKLRPAGLALIETELWPNLLHQAHAAGVPVVVLNGRLSERRMARYRRMRHLYRPLLAGIARVGAQSDDDARRFVELGVPPSAVEVTGNIKFDLPLPDADPGALRRRLALAERPVFVAGSTARGEDEAVLQAFADARREHSDLFLVLAPRHPERADEVAALIEAHDLRARRISAGDADAARDADVLLVDTVGHLTELYSAATVAFVGGSLVPIGGHNVMEPAAAGVPVLFGPRTENVEEPAEALTRARAARRVANADALSRALVELLADAFEREAMVRRAHGVLEANRGALQRSVALLLAAIGRDA
ncbi:MAG: 3-deoxy-D-manno-octulosonic acid transferase [bacterium]|nr:3-deoxy-D-manno-octulosonic acid transferase [bacterium]